MKQNVAIEPVITSPAGAEEAKAPRPRRRMKRRLAVHGVQVLILVGFIGIWQLAADNNWIDVFLYGKPSQIPTQLHTWFSHGTAYGSIWHQISVTMQETVYGFLIGSAAGIVLGVSLGRVAFLAEVFGPYIKVFNSIPRIVLGAMFVVWFGLGQTGKVALAVVLVFFAVFFNAFQGTVEVDRNLINNARILGANPLQVTWQVVIPSALTWIIASLHVAFGFALIGAVVGEMLGAQGGIGLLIHDGQNNFNPAAMYAGTLIVAVMALLAEFLITRLEKRLLSWRPPSQQELASF